MPSGTNSTERKRGSRAAVPTRPSNPLGRRKTLRCSLFDACYQRRYPRGNQFDRVRQESNLHQSWGQPPFARSLPKLRQNTLSAVSSYMRRGPTEIGEQVFRSITLFAQSVRCWWRTERSRRDCLVCSDVDGLLSCQLLLNRRGEQACGWLMFHRRTCDVPRTAGFRHVG